MTGARYADIAVIAMAGAFPGSAGIAEFWRMLRLGKEGITFFTTEELLARGVDRARLSDPAYVKAAAVLSGAFDFDAAFFGYSKREAELMDPQHRLFLEYSWEVMERAGYAGEAGRGRVAVFAGASMNTYLTNALTDACDLRSLAGTSLMLGNDKDYLPTRVSYKLNLTGPSINVQTGCSTSLVAIHMAVQSLLAGECELALAGGVSVHVAHATGYLHEEGLMFSSDGHCRAFDTSAGGTPFGDGVGVVLLKRLSDAIADGDSIHAAIKGSAVNNDGAEKIGYAAPSARAQEAVVTEALAVAEIDSDSIGFIEAHGTGTALGDPIEFAALTAAFRRGSRRTGYCALGSVKTNIGHAAAAAGVAGFIKAVLAVEHGEIPPHLHLRAAHPELRLDDSPFFINTKLCPWPGAGTRRAGVSSFGLGGTNAHVVLEQAPSPPRSGASRTQQLICVSAKSHAALTRLSNSLAIHCENIPDLVLADAAFTLAIGRRAFRHRRAIICGSVDQAAALLSSGPSPTIFDGEAGGSSKICFVFDGELALDDPAVGRLRAEQPSFRGELEQVLALFDAKRFGHSRVIQRFACGYTLGRLWMRWGIRPDVVVGQGVGRYAAACIAEAWSLNDAVELLVARECDARGIEEGQAPSRTGTVAEVCPRPTRYPIVSVVHGDWIAEGRPFDSVDDARQVAEADEFHEALGLILDQDAECILLQIGGCEAVCRRLREHPRRTQQRVIASFHDPEAAYTDGSLLLGALAQLWCIGTPVDWASYYEGQHRRRIPLPTYPFERRRYAIEPRNRAVAMQSDPFAIHTEMGPAVQLYYESWRRDEAVGVPVDLPADKGGHWLILLDNSDLGSVLAHRIRAAGGSVATARVAVSSATQTSADPTIDPSDQGAYEIVAAAIARGRGACHVVHLGALQSGEPPAASGALRATIEGVYSIARLARACSAIAHNVVFRLTVVTRGAHDVTGGEPITPEQRALLAAVIGIPQEYSNIACVAIDLPSLVAAEAAAEMLLMELCRDAADHIVALRRGFRWTQHYLPLHEHGHTGTPLVLRGTYLITGGLGRIGLALADYLARTVGARMVLTTRSDFPAVDRWDSCHTASGAPDRLGAIIARLRHIERQGGAVMVAQADVTDERAMDAVISATEARFGRIHGWIHAAGVVGADAFASIEHSSPAEWERIMGPKIEGILVLDRLFAERALDFGVVMSSLAAQLGGIGHVAYAAANLFLDATVEQRNAKRPYLAVNWDRWLFEQEASGQVPKVGERGGSASVGLTVSDAVIAFDRALRQIGQRRVVVAAGNLHARVHAALQPASIVSVCTAWRPADNDDRTASRATSVDTATNIARIWKEVLGLEDVDARANFFESGGDSLSGSALATRIRRDLGLRAEATDLFEAPTLTGFVDLVIHRASLEAARDPGVCGGAPERWARREVGP